jgi:hypothetical protein
MLEPAPDAHDRLAVKGFQPIEMVGEFRLIDRRPGDNRGDPACVRGFGEQPFRFAASVGTG